MNQETYVKQFAENANAMISLTQRKNADYAGAEDAFKNFRLIELVTGGRVSMADGILVRMSDKFARLANLMGREAQVSDEAITDTCFDLAVYSLILKLALEESARNNEPPAAQVRPEPFGPDDMRAGLLAEAKAAGGVEQLSPMKRWLLAALTQSQGAS